MKTSKGAKIKTKKTAVKRGGRDKTKDLAHFIAEAAEDKKAADIKIIDVKKITPMTDYLVLCSAQSSPQIKAIASHIEDKLRDKGERSIRWEGKVDSNWLILDIGKIVIHIMGEVEREKYKLEDIWGKKAIVYHL